MIDLFSFRFLGLICVILLLKNLFSNWYYSKYFLFSIVIGFFILLGFSKTLMIIIFSLFVYQAGIVLQKINNDDIQIKLYNVYFALLVILFILIEVLLSKQFLLGLGAGLYLLHGISWVHDIVFKDASAKVNVFDFLLYFLFPFKLFVGPIENRSNLFSQIQENGQSGHQLILGIKLIILGVFKKFILFNWLITDEYYISGTIELGLIGNVLFIFNHWLKIYVGFSGFIDLIRGISLLYGFDLLKNFNRPFLSNSFSDYWNRWHTSMSKWLLEYFFTPLTFSLRIIFKKHTSLIVLILTFSLINLWHGLEINYWLFGFLHFCFLVIEKVFKIDWTGNNKSVIKRFLFLFLLGYISLFFTGVSVKLFKQVNLNLYSDVLKFNFFGENSNLLIYLTVLLFLTLVVERIELFNRLNKKDIFIFGTFLLLIFLAWPENKSTLVYLF